MREASRPKLLANCPRTGRTHQGADESNCYSSAFALRLRWKSLTRVSIAPEITTVSNSKGDLQGCPSMSLSSVLHWAPGAASRSRMHVDLSLYQATMVVHFDEYTGRMHAPNRPASGPSLAGNTCVPPPGILPEAGLPGAVSA